MSSPTQCNLDSAESYNKCMDRAHLSVFKTNRIKITPNQAMNKAVILILVLLFLHYIKVITLPLKFIPQMK